LKTSAGRATKLSKLQPCKAFDALEYKVHKMNPHTLEEVSNHICHEISTFSWDIIQRVNKSMSCRYKECCWSGG
jgi:hypothetical protein